MSVGKLGYIRQEIFTSINSELESFVKELNKSNSELESFVKELNKIQPPTGLVHDLVSSLGVRLKLMGETTAGGNQKDLDEGLQRKLLGNIHMIRTHKALAETAGPLGNIQKALFDTLLIIENNVREKLGQRVEKKPDADLL